MGDIRRLVDRYLESVAGQCRPDTLRAVAFDLKAFFAVTGEGPVAPISVVTAAWCGWWTGSLGCRRG